MGAPDLVAKIYTDRRAEDRREKIEAMVAAELHRQAPHISFPIDVLLDDKDRFVGFTMRRIKGPRPIHQLWGSRDRQEKFPDATVAFMVRVAGNAARAVGELRQAGCVIGDINESGFLVTDQATVVLIDSDSIQFTLGRRVFPCVVGTPQYLPPEHQGINQRQLGPRAPNHDNFGLAVMIFRLLMAGTHPFMGKWNGGGDPPALPKWIEEFRYAYGADSARMKVSPQPAAPPAAWLSDEIRGAFDQAFGKSGVQARPTAGDWIGLLDRFEKSLIPCGRSRFHHHRAGTRSCPWCETEKARGKQLFGPPKPNFQQKPFTAPPGGPRPAPPRPRPPPNNSLRNTAIAVVGVTIAALWMFGGGEEQTARAPTQPQPPEEQRIEADKREFAETLPQQAARERARILALAKEEKAKAQAWALSGEIDAALAAGGAGTARARLGELTSLRQRLEQNYVLRIVAKPGQHSGVWRAPRLNPQARNYYLLVEAVDDRGQPVPVAVTSEEDNRTAETSTFGIRVDERTYERVRADKQDDGIIQNNRFGEKQVGYLEPRYNFPTPGGAILDWAWAPPPASGTSGSSSKAGTLRGGEEQAARVPIQPQPQAGTLPAPPDSLTVLQQVGVGAWVGSVTQPSSRKSYSMRLYVAAGEIKVEYPELSCGGTWFLEGSSSGTARLRERIDYGGRRCVTTGYVIVKAQNRSELYFEWSRRKDGPREAWATLRRE